MLRKPLFYILFIIFILWAVLFEFIIPRNGFLPRPGIVILSIPALFEDYHLIPNFFTTISAVYLPPLLSYLLLYLFRQTVFRRTGVIKIFIDFILQVSVFFPAVLLGILFLFWFPHSFLIEYIFSFIISALWWLTEITSEDINANENYRVSLKSMGADEIFIQKYILWNEVKPAVFGNLKRFHLHLWTIILIFEFISQGYGLGSILSQIMTYRDLSALWLIIILISIIIGAGYIFLKYFENRFIFWSKE